MKKSKRISAFIAAVLMTVTMFSSAIPAYAEFYCGSYKVKTGFVATNTQATARTFSDYTCDYIRVYLTGQEVDKNGNRLQLVGDNRDKSNTNDTGFVTIKLKSSNAVKFDSAVSTHAAKIKGYENWEVRSK